MWLSFVNEHNITNRNWTEVFTLQTVVSVFGAHKSFHKRIGSIIFPADKPQVLLPALPLPRQARKFLIFARCSYISMHYSIQPSKRLSKLHGRGIIISILQLMKLRHGTFGCKESQSPKQDSGPSLQPFCLSHGSRHCGLAVRGPPSLLCPS